MADVLSNDFLADFESSMEQETDLSAEVAEVQEQVALTSEEDLEGFAGCFAEWDIRPTDITDQDVWKKK